MHGVTTAIVAFVFACLVFPNVIKNKPQYYASVGVVLGVILFDALARVIGNPAFARFAYLLTAILQMGAIFLLILSAGGLTMRDLAGDLADTIEVIRRGGEDKEIIVPRRGETPRPRGGRDAYDRDNDGRPARIDLDAELRAAHPPPPGVTPTTPTPPAAPPPGTSSGGPPGASPARPNDPESDDRGIPLA